MAAIMVSCNRAVAFGARCPNDTLGDNVGVCAEHLKAESPRAPAPDVVLVKFQLHPSVASVAAELFRGVTRLDDHVEQSHEAVAQAIGLQFKGLWRGEDKPGDSGVPVLRRTETEGELRKPGIKDATIAPLRQELERAGFVLADVHTFANHAGNQILVLGYRMVGKLVSLRGDQRRFIDGAWLKNWGYCTVWANIPEMEALVGDTRFKYIVLEERGDKLLIQVTRPRMEETAEIDKKEIRESRPTTLHTVNVGGSSKGFKSALVYADGLWGIK